MPEDQPDDVHAQPDQEPVREALTWLERHGSKRQRDAIAERYAIHAPKSFGVSVGEIQRLAKRLGPDHELAAALWETGWYEARMLSAYMRPGRVTAAQMDRWARDFDNWGICDTLCFVLFSRTAHAWRKVEHWSRRRDEFVKRAAFATWPRSPCATSARGRAVPPFAARWWTCRWRRPQLRPEGRELGPARDRRTEQGAERRGGPDGPPAVGIGQRRGAVGGKGRPPTAAQSGGAEAARDPQAEDEGSAPSQELTHSSSNATGLKGF